MKRYEQINLIKLQCEQCTTILDEKLQISTQCLHRFCASCVSNLNKCPQCGVSTRFQQDSNLSRLLSKINHNKITKKGIVDVLKNDGADITQQNGKLSNMAYGNISSKRFKSELPTKKALSHANEPSTSSASLKMISINGDFKQRNEPKAINTRSSDGEFQRLPKSVNLCHRQALNKNYSRMEAIVLWPDGVNYRIRELPKCLLRPRYIFIPPITTVAHLAEYLYRRAELEAGVELRFNYRIEFMPVEDERDEINLWVNPMRDIDYLSIEFKSNMQDSHTGEYVLILRKNQEDSYFCTNLIMRHPFKPLEEDRTVWELLSERQSSPTTNACFNEFIDTKTNFAAGQTQQQGEEDKRPPKFVFRFVRRT